MPKRRDTRILRRLQYFEASARLKSVALAAEELGVSPSAVSHQLSDLKRTIGEDLFEKSGRGLKLTKAGQRLAQRLSTAFNMLDTSVENAIGGGHRLVRVAACSAFGPYWLAPRLKDLQRAHPNIEIELRLYAKDPELTHASADCIITAQEVNLGYDYLELFDEEAIAVAAPGLVKDRRLPEMPLITTDTADAELGDDWRVFVANTGEDVELPTAAGWFRCSHYILALETAKAGLGAALIPDFVARAAIAEGHLVQLGHGTMNLEGRTYRVCFKEARKDDTDVQAVAKWLRRTARNGQSAAIAAQ